MKPTMGRIVRYRGKQGLHAPRPAIVVTTTGTLDPRGVEHDARLRLSSDTHVHLHVLTPSDAGFFTEYDVPQGDGPGEWNWPERVDA